MLCTTLVAAFLGAAEPVIVEGPLGRRLDDAMTRLEHLGFSGAVVVAKDDEVVLQKGYGLADREAGRPVTPDTVFTVGSITKQFTGAAILKLQMQGTLSVDDPISRHLDDVPPDKRDITIHHLLTHTAGLIDVLGGDHDLEATRDRVVAAALASDLQWKPGTQYQYSNLGYSLAAAIVERVSGRGYEAFLREHLFEPAGMMHTGSVLPEFATDTLAVGYRDDERWGTVLGRPLLDDGPCWNLRGNGGIHSTVADMYRWHLAVADDRILSDEARTAWQTGHVDEGGGRSRYGYGWAVTQTSRDTPLVWHNGGNGVFFANFWRYPEENVVIYMATNVGSRFDDPVNSMLASLCIGFERELPPKTHPLTAARLDAVTGMYELPSGARIRVSSTEKGLRLVGTVSEAVDLLRGGDGASDAAELAIGTKARRVVEAIMLGDFEGVHRLLGGSVPLARVQQMGGNLRDMLIADYDSYRRATLVFAVGDEDRAQTAVRIELENGTVFLAMGWEAGEIADLDLSEDPPMTSVRVFPIAADRFVAFDMRNPVDVEVTLADETLVFHTGSGDVTARRARMPSDRPGLDTALAAARWIDSLTVETEHGIAWPADADEPDGIARHLYGGSSGVILFYLALHETTGDRHWLRQARRGADDLIGTLAPVEGGTPAGLWTGVAGTGFTLHRVYLATLDDTYLDGARACVRLLRTGAVRDDDGLHWNSGTDIISGAAGVGLFMLYAVEHMHDPEQLEVARRAGDWLLAQVEPAGPYWKMTPQSPHQMPGFSHGTAGVGYFLARLDEVLDAKRRENDGRYLSAAVKGARYLQSITETESDETRHLIAHHLPGGEQLHYLGWCHGPVGTARLFHQLARVTGDASWNEWPERGAAAIMSSGIPRQRTSGFWNNVGQCCGSAGVASFFLDMHRRTADDQYLRFARVMSLDVIRAGVPQDGGMHWPQAEHRVRPRQIRSQTGYMQGAAGVALWLLALDAYEQGTRLKLRFPDSPY